MVGGSERAEWGGALLRARISRGRPGAPTPAIDWIGRIRGAEQRVVLIRARRPVVRYSLNEQPTDPTETELTPAVSLVVDGYRTERSVSFLRHLQRGRRTGRRRSARPAPPAPGISAPSLVAGVVGAQNRFPFFSLSFSLSPLLTQINDAR